MDSTTISSASMNELLALSVPEKLTLIGALWDSIEAAGESPPLLDWQVAELERRDAAEQSSLEPTVSWDEAVQRIRASHAHSRST